MSEAHDLFLTGPEEEGVSEWLCHVCGRKLLVSRFPEFSRIVVIEGNYKAQHVAVFDNKRVVSVGSKTVPLTPDTKWLLDHGIDWNSDANTE